MMKLIEKRIIKNDEELLMYLLKRGACFGRALKLIFHEREHINKAEELGHNFSSYNISCFIDDNWVSGKVQASPQFYNGDAATLEDIKKIAMAPKNLSEGDLQLIRDIDSLQ